MNDRHVSEERKILADLLGDSYKGFDKSLLLVSSGAVALSVTALNNFPHPHAVLLLILCWLCLMGSIVVQLWSFLVGTAAIRKEMEILSEEHDKSSGEMTKNPLTGKATFYSKVAFAAFVAGVIFFLLFVVGNLHPIMGSYGHWR